LEDIMETNNELMGKGMRRVMLAAALLNTLGAVTFIPAFTGLRAQGHLPNDAHPVYLWMISLWILFFGAAYLYLGITGRVEKVLSRSAPRASYRSSGCFWALHWRVTFLFRPPRLASWISFSERSLPSGYGFGEAKVLFPGDTGDNIFPTVRHNMFE
jgi:hypothetical protein